MSDKDKKKVEELKKKHSDIIVPEKDMKSDKSFKKSLEKALSKEGNNEAD